MSLYSAQLENLQRAALALCEHAGIHVKGCRMPSMTLFLYKPYGTQTLSYGDQSLRNDKELQRKSFVITGLRLGAEPCNNSSRDPYGILEPNCDNPSDCIPDAPVCLASDARNTAKSPVKADTKGVPSLELEEREDAPSQNKENSKTKLDKQTTEGENTNTTN